MGVLVLPYKGKILEEIRPAYFLRAFDKEAKNMRIISFGKCNYSCPYCKRGGNTKDETVIEGSIEITKETLFMRIDDAIAKNQVIRLSGGDPICYPELSLEINIDHHVYGEELEISRSDLEIIIQNVRMKARMAQGITMEQEEQAKTAIEQLGDLTEKRD